jgi:hypothetical protein
MRQLIGILLTVLVSVIAPCQAPSDYGVLLSRLKAGDTKISYRLLRFSYWNSPEAGAARNTDEEQKQMMTSLHTKNYQDAVKNADVVLANSYLDINAHFVAFIAHREMQHLKQAQFHKAVLEGLLKSITDSGDGESAKTAFAVISPEEERAVLRSVGVLAMTTTSSELDGHTFDVVQVRDPQTGDQATLYFNTDVWTRHLQHSTPSTLKGAAH